MTEVETPPVTVVEEEERHRGRRIAVGALVLVLCCGATAGGVLAWRGRSAAPAAAPAHLVTAPVTRADLRQYQQIDGTLGYADSYDVPAAPGGGTLTWLPSVGDRISEGSRVYEVDGLPVPLVYGSVPLWRTLEVGVDDGPDVRELKRALRALGYGPDLADDDHYSQATADAVGQWQSDLGRPQTGTLAPGQVVVEPGQVRVTGVRAVLGAPATGVLLSLSSTRRLVTVPLPVDQQQLARAGAAVTVALPGGATVTGHIADVGTVASTGGSGAAGGANGPTGASGSGGTDPGSTAASGSVQGATLPVHITLDQPNAAGSLDGAPVTVSFTSEVHTGVLTVPVSALLALAGGGYAVERVGSGGTTTLLPVTLGMFAQGRVEVSGPGLTPGLPVEVPSS
ncbi:peptidoglycan-binding protein [Streptacidiphilus jiangxiensis]|uniref:Multidrug efflux pump subunit AcrA (Membrane-fusion protein) n=1 Tax=Streptacidiphilus jiangxiensis TaxID=235985 RepID=A0A1H7L0F5_STRJI|nr:peptidoglycan-binding protein [Streptacidiphilus jiangxiensis]SEK92472.1 Multidrug efflux pump subunit AcrA (membrane-fusion protein) [Streptacidiphilus jiangxiensis]